MKITNVSIKNDFKSYSKLIDIKIENKKDELLLLKLNQLATEENIQIDPITEDYLEDLGFTSDEKDASTKLVQEIFKQL